MSTFAFVLTWRIDSRNILTRNFNFAIQYTRKERTKRNFNIQFPFTKVDQLSSISIVFGKRKKGGAESILRYLAWNSLSATGKNYLSVFLGHQRSPTFFRRVTSTRSTFIFAQANSYRAKSPWNSCEFNVSDKRRIVRRFFFSWVISLQFSFRISCHFWRMIVKLSKVFFRDQCRLTLFSPLSAILSNVPRRRHRVPDRYSSIS